MVDDGGKKSKKRKGSFDEEAEAKATKEELAVAKYLRFGLQEKEGKLAGMVVSIFIASEALDLLMESKWASDPRGRYPQLFSSRAQAESYMNQLMTKKLFHRAQKVKKKSRRKDDVISKKGNKKSVKGTAETTSNDNGDTNAGVEGDGESKDNTVDDTDQGKVVEEGTDAEEKKTTKKDKRAGKKARVKLEMHDHHVFVDGDEVYVWLYEPTRVLYVILGFLVLIVIVGFCLFPLWPMELRSGAYYMSVGAMGLLMAFLGVALLRGVLFATIWCCTMGRHHFWLFPNLSEDCGVKESFIPFYSHEVKEGAKISKSKKKD